MQSVLHLSIKQTHHHHHHHHYHPRQQQRTQHFHDRIKQAKEDKKCLVSVDHIIPSPGLKTQHEIVLYLSIKQAQRIIIIVTTLIIIIFCNKGTTKEWFVSGGTYRGHWHGSIPNVGWQHCRLVGEE